MYKNKNCCRICSVLYTASNLLIWPVIVTVIISLCALGEAEKPCVLSLVDDTLYEEGEELRLVLGNPRSDSQFGASVGALTETLVKIKDSADSKCVEAEQGEREAAERQEMHVQEENH